MDGAARGPPERGPAGAGALGPRGAGALGGCGPRGGGDTGARPGAAGGVGSGRAARAGPGRRDGAGGGAAAEPGERRRLCPPASAGGGSSGARGRTCRRGAWEKRSKGLWAGGPAGLAGAEPGSGRRNGEGWISGSPRGFTGPDGNMERDHWGARVRVVRSCWNGARRGWMLARGPGQRECTEFGSQEWQRARGGSRNGLLGCLGWGEPSAEGGLCLVCCGAPLPPFSLRCRVCLGASSRNVTAITPPHTQSVMPFSIKS